MENAVYKLKFDCGRQGELEGLFVAPRSHVKKLIESGINVYFGEVLGKHSEVCGPVEASEIIFVSDNPEVIKVIEEFDLQNGYNPFDYQVANTDREVFGDLSVGEAIAILISEEP